MIRNMLIGAVAALGLVGCGQPSNPGTPSAEQPAPDAAPPPAIAGAVADAGARWTFAKGAVGSLPEGFRSVVGTWGLGVAGETRGLLQSARNGDPVFNVLLIDTERYADVEISVRVHAIDGKVDQGGGPVWRAQDGQNYYIARWNPLEDNYRVYKVVNGLRTQLATAKTTRGPTSRLLNIRMTGSLIECSLDGEALLRADDKTFPSEGRIGLWTKADAHTLFSDLRAFDL